MTAVIFDLDGTLVDSRAVMEAAFRAAYRQEVSPGEPPLDEFFGLLGESFPRILEQLGLPPSMYEPFQVESRSRLAEITLHQGVVGVCDRLREVGIPVGLLTGKDRERTLEILDWFSLGDHFSAIATGSDGFRPKPAPDGVVLLCRELGTCPEMTALVGDGTFDILAAKRAGALAVGCTWGMATHHALLDAQADIVVHDAHQLSDALSRWLEDLPDGPSSRRRAAREPRIAGRRTTGPARTT
jgi:3-amino-5-hydroxybenzoic acid synthesis related protein